MEGDHSDAVAERSDAETAIRAALARLSDTDQEVLRLAAWEQLDTPALAYVLECSEVAARVRLHRATRRLRVMLTVPARPDAAPREVPSDDFSPSTWVSVVPKIRTSDNFPH